MHCLFFVTLTYFSVINNNQNLIIWTMKPQGIHQEWITTPVRISFDVKPGLFISICSKEYMLYFQRKERITKSIVNYICKLFPIYMFTNFWRLLFSYIWVPFKLDNNNEAKLSLLIFHFLIFIFCWTLFLRNSLIDTWNVLRTEMLFFRDLFNFKRLLPLTKRFLQTCHSSWVCFCFHILRGEVFFTAS